VAEALCHNSTLKSLVLSENFDIGVIGASVLAKALRVNQSLTSLNLAMCNVKSAGARQLAESLSVNSTLTELNLMRNGIGFASGGVLLNSMQSVHSTFKLLLAENRSEWVSDDPDRDDEQKGPRKEDEIMGGLRYRQVWDD
jgi:hypothetical protein